MRIGIDVTAISYGRGPGRFLNEILSALDRMDTGRVEFYLYTPYPMGLDLSSKFIIRYIPKVIYKSWLNWSLPREVVKDRIELMFFPANDFWLWPYRKTVVAILDVAPATILKSYHHSWMDRLQNKLQMIRLDKVARKLITISRYSRDQICQTTRIPPEKIQIIYCGASEKYQPPISGERREEFILYIGSFDRRKNLERLLDAFKIMVDRGCRTKLCLGGHIKKDRRDKLYYDIYELIGSRGLEDMVEIRENPEDDFIINLYQRAKLFVFPSIIEGFGLPVLEAMACGCPVVCSRAASLPEVGGDAAVYFDPYDAKDMSEKIISVLNDEELRRKMSAMGLVQARKFDWNRTASRIYEILKDAAQNG